MPLSFFIARRYLFSKKKQNAINIISAISVVGLAIGTAALVIVLSVFNGMDVLLQKTTNSFYPDLVIKPINGKYMSRDTALFRELSGIGGLDYWYSVIEEKAIAKYDDKYLPITVKGVDADYILHSNISQYVIDGDVKLNENNNYYALVGYGIASNLNLFLKGGAPITLYYPNKNVTGNSLGAINSQYLFSAAVFSMQQEIDNQYLITDIRFAQKLFMTDNQISKIEIKLLEGGDLDKVKKTLSSVISLQYEVIDKYEINRAFYAMMRSEKLAVFMVLLFILLIASFNIIGSISMLILDKKDDLVSYRAMGMTQRDVTNIFRMEGQLITFIGTFLGMLIGITVSLVQEYYGVVTLGDGSFIVDAYPVSVIASDIVVIVLIVLLIGQLASTFPVRYLVAKLYKNSNSLLSDV